MIRPESCKLICARPAIVLMAIVLATQACHKAENPQARAVETYIADSGSVAFDIVRLQVSGDSNRYICTFSSVGKTAKFEIELGPERDMPSKEPAPVSMQTGKGSFVAVPGSNGTELLSALKKALEAKNPVPKQAKIQTLPFVYVDFGRNLSQARDGGFSTNPPGNWRTMKIFLGEGDDESEVFVNLNPAIGKGQFSIKDAEYGDQVLEELAKVL